MAFTFCLLQLTNEQTAKSCIKSSQVAFNRAVWAWRMPPRPALAQRAVAADDREYCCNF